LDDSTNLSRMLRQQQYLNALSKNVQVCLEGDDTFLVNVVSETSKYMESDCTVEQLSSILDKATTYQSNGIVIIEGEAVQGEQYMEFYADEASLKNFVIQIFYESYTKEKTS
ncbi:MAG: hypothetical protein PHE09_03850, partial [Oscillospiraceae bacterium]|nr:hypothetical protein [Oscillospiraceae bacterium]